MQSSSEDAERAARPSTWTALRRGLRRLCPGCGQSELFESWNVARERCPVCSLVFEPQSGDTWFFMYFTTAGLTGLTLAGMLLLQLDSLLLSQLVLIPTAIVLIAVTLPFRKGLAIALDYLVRRSAGDADQPS